MLQPSPKSSIILFHNILSGINSIYKYKIADDKTTASFYRRGEYGNPYKLRYNFH